MSTNSFYADRKFWAEEYFPRGLGRSGEFTVKQVALLEAHGQSYKSLAEGYAEPQTTEEENFVAVFRGLRQAETEHERAWQRFLNVTSRKNNPISWVSASFIQADFSDYSDDRDIA